MADKAVFEIIVTDKGLKINQKKVEELGASVEKTTRRTREAGKATDELNYKLNQGTIGTSSAARSFSKLNQTIGEGPNGLVGAYATLAANAFAVSAAFNALRTASQAEAVMKGLEVQGARLGLTLTNTGEKIQEISRGSLSMAESMEAAAQASAAGFTSKNIEDLASAAQNASIALGRNMSDSLDRMIKGTTKLEPELLDELGVMVKLTEANNKYALANNKSAASLTSVERRQAFLNAVLEESTLKFGGLSEKVEANPYDRLASSFRNLTTDTLNFINTTAGVREVVGFLADNTGALVAVIVLFASTISRQLIPSLYEASEAAERATRVIDTKIQAQKRQIAVTLLQAKAEKEAAAATATSKIDVAGSPQKVKEYVEALKNGTAEENKRKEALKSLNGALGGHEAALNRMKDKESEAYKTKQQLITSLEAQRDSLRTLTTEQIRHENIVSKSQATLDGLRRQSVGLRLQNLAQTSRANAIEAAGEGNLRTALSETSRSAVAYYRGIDNVAKGQRAAAVSGGFFNRVLAGTYAVSVPLRGAIFAVSVGVRALGAAFLNLLPIIGQVLFVWELLKQLYSYIKDIFFPDPAGTKQLQAAAESYKNILESTKEAAEVSQNIFNNAARSSTAITSGLSAVSNKINELVDGFLELEQRKKTLGTDAAKQIAKPLEAITIVSGKEVKDEAKDAVEGLSALRSLGYAPLVKEIDKTITNNKEFWNSTGEEQARIASRVLIDLKDKFGALGETIKSLDENYKKISESYDSFINNATISTPFDDLTKNWDEQSLKITELRKNVQKGTMSLDDFGKKIAQIKDDSTMAFIDDAALQKQVTAVQNLEAYYQKQKKILESGELTDYKEVINQLRLVEALPAKIQDGYAAIANEMERAQLETAKELVSKQRAYVVSQGELKLLQARLQSTSRIQSSGEEGLRLRLKLEKQSRDIQISNLQVQKSFIEASIEHSENQLKFRHKELRLADEALAKDKARTLEELKRSAIRLGIAQRDLQEDAKPIKLRGAGNAATNRAEVEAQETYLTALKESKELSETIKQNEAKRETEVKQQEVENRRKKLSVLSLESEIQVIREQGLSTGMTEAMIAQARLNRTAQEREDRLGILEQEQTLVEIAKKRSAILSGNAESFSEELRLIKQGAEAEKRKIANAYDVQRLRVLGEIIVAERDVAEASADEQKAAQETLRSAQNRLEVLDLSTEATLRQKDAETDLAIQSKLYIDTKKQGLEFQVQSLAYIERELQLVNELSKTRLATAQINRELDLKRRGLFKSEEQQQAFEIQNATLAYEIAVKEASLKKSLIDLEFALLDGQREVLKQQLIERKAAMLEAGYSEENTSVKQLSAAIDNLNKSPAISALAEKAKEQVDANIQQLGAILQNTIAASGNENNPIVKMLSTIEGIRQKAAAREEAKRALSQSRASSEVGKTVIETGEKQLNVAKVGVSRSNELLEEIRNNTKVNAEQAKKDMPVPVINARTTDMDKAMGQAVEMAQKAGFNAYGLGSKSTVHKGAGHREGRAIDVDLVKGNEADNPKLAKRMTDMAVEYAEKGYTVLWDGLKYQLDANGKLITSMYPKSWGPHKDHLHVEAKASGVIMGNAVADTAAAKIENAVSNAAEETFGGEIIVSATPPYKPAMEAPSVLPTGQGDVLGDISPTLMTTFSGTNWDAIKDKVGEVRAVVAMYTEDLIKLGPQGEVAAAIAQGSVLMLETGTKALETLDTIGASTADKVSAVAGVVSAALSVAQSITEATSKARIANIDKEIAAEQKRDGKSAQSLAKIEAMEKKKDNIARKQFNINKKISMAQAVIATATGIAEALKLGPIAGPIMAGLIGALGMAQIAIISGTQYESSLTPKTPSMPSSLSIGKRSDSVDLARGPNANAGSEAGYLRGAQGTGSNASNFRTIGSAYGGELMRGYGNRGFVVGEKGPEVLSPETPINVTPASEVQGGQPINASFNIQALDASGVQDILVSQKGNIIKMLREASNASGKSFMEDVNVNVYTRPSIGKL